MTTSNTPRKAPQDRKPKAEKTVRPEDVAGMELLKTIDEIPVWDQAPLLSLVKELMGDAEEGEEVTLDKAQAINILGAIGQAMLPFAHDEKAFTKFCSGRDALTKIADLAMAWTSALGEEKSSGDS